MSIATRRNSQMPRARVPGWPTAVSCVLAAATLAALIIVALAVTGEASTKGKIDSAPLIGERIERTLASPAVAGCVAALLAVLLAYFVRLARLRWLGRHAPAIAVADLVSAQQLEDGLLEHLTLYFRKRMASLHLASPGAQPGVAPASGFVELVAQAGSGMNSAGKFIAGLVQAAWPTQAYEVHATLIQREEAPRFGVSVQVVLLPNLATTPETCWAPTWETVVDRASNFAAAFILPRSHPGRRPPWSAWQGFVMPPHLLDDYERASNLCHARRYDEALEKFYLALNHDPKNIDVRLKIGFVQEKVGMALDALATYDDVCVLARACDRGWTHALFDWRSRRTRDRSARVAQYRRAVLLGSGERLTARWVEPDHEPLLPRDAQRAELRARLSSALPGADAATAKGEDDLCAYFQRQGEDAFKELRGIIPRITFGLEDASLTRRAVALSEECVRVRLRGWSAPPTVDQLERRVSRSRRVSEIVGRVTWAERYNAASLYALAIRFTGASDEDKELLSVKAVQELERALQRASSGYVASRREWLLAEDPDLDALRETAAFKRFTATYFPGVDVTKARPRDGHDWECAQYVVRLVTACAMRRSALWEQRAKNGAALDPAWSAEDDAAWKLIATVAADCHHWQARLAFITGLHDWAAAYGWRHLPLAYPSPSELPASAGCSAATDALEARLADAVERVGKSSKSFGAGNSSAVRRDAWEDLVGALTEQS
ncbi:hypothetical protein [Solirubrobacter soli]|uniref:hypothetical protein n=1 Tax=Solirubrobacter soli TaxID=363832 RepID=UPI00055C03E2|nr:hypothetical protein [Solirubrobacter soli]